MLMIFYLLCSSQQKINKKNVLWDFFFFVKNLRWLALKSSDILRKPPKFGPTSNYNLTLLSNVKKRVEDEPHFCGILRISELQIVLQK